VEGESVNLVVRNPPRTDRALVEGLTEFGVSTIHEAQGRTHLLDPALRPARRQGAEVHGRAVIGAK
jgi:4-hydroxy-4-methyl-2-oxoglutarate aldolase